MRKFLPGFLFAAWLFSLLTGAEDPHPDPLLKAAREGDILAQIRLADEYFFGRNDRIKNAALGFFWLHKAAQSGSAAAQFNLGVCYEKGWGVPASRRIAYFWFEKAAAQGVPQAVVRQADILYKGVDAAKAGDIEYLPVPADPEKALNMLRACQDDEEDAQLYLIKLLFLDAPHHEKELRETLEKYCRRPDADSEGFILYSACLRTGIGGPPDPAAGARYLQKAADMKNPEAIAQLAEIYDLGSGLPIDREKALHLAEEAAALNSPRALVYLGSRYLAGDAVKADHQKAFLLFSQAAQVGYPPALRCQGDCYALGAGTVKDEKEALECYEAAAEAGDAQAKSRIARCYREGRGVPVNPTIACYWFEQAAIAGDVTAMREAGIAYWNGDGVRRDPAKARRLLEAAAAAGDNIAREIITFR